MQNSIPIFLPSDNNYAPFLATTIASICDNTVNFCEIYILDGGITEDNKVRIEKLKEKFKNFSIEYLKIDIEKIFDGFKIPNYINVSTYMRLLIPELNKNINKALYIDTDAIALGDISEIYNTDLE